jgi:kinesin family protein 2/24
VAILCPEGAFGEKEVEKEDGSKRYICTEISPSVMADAYTLAIEHQCLVALDEMEKEVLMEYDGATRFYFINV